MKDDGKCPDCGQRLNGSAHRANCGAAPTTAGHQWRIDPYASCDIIGMAEPSYLAERIAQVYGYSKETREARATQIVNEHNNHETLIAALRMVVDAEWNSDWIIKAQENARSVLEQIEKQ